MEAGLEASDYTIPPISFPFGTTLRRGNRSRHRGSRSALLAIDDCGQHHQPVIVDGQFSGGLAWPAPGFEEITTTKTGNNSAAVHGFTSSTAMETPNWETARRDARPPPAGAKESAKSATVAPPRPAIVNLVSPSHLGVEAHRGSTPRAGRHVADSPTPLAPAVVREGVTFAGFPVGLHGRGDEVIHEAAGRVVAVSS